MILLVFKSIGDRFSAVDAYRNLLQLYKNELYAKNKASGSLGGAVNGGTVFLGNNGYYERIR